MKEFLLRLEYLLIDILMFMPLCIFFGIIIPLYMKFCLKKGGEYNEE